MTAVTGSEWELTPTTTRTLDGRLHSAMTSTTDDALAAIAQALEHQASPVVARIGKTTATLHAHARARLEAGNDGRIAAMLTALLPTSGLRRVKATGVELDGNDAALLGVLLAQNTACESLQ